MHRTFVIAAVILLASGLVIAQSKTNETISRQIKALQEEKSITVTFDPGGNSSKVMAVAENFSNKEADRAGLQAMNFAAGFFYPGTSLLSSPASVHFAFWVMSKKPRFAEDHKFIVQMGNKQLDLGEARYAAKRREDMEYLNFQITRSDLTSIAAADNVTFRVGPYVFAVTRAQLKLIRNLARIADTSITN